MSDVIVITYDSEEKGLDALNRVVQLEQQGQLQLEDAAVAIRNEDGRVLVRQTLENQTSGAAESWGSTWGLMTGLMFRGPAFWAMVGATVGMATGQFADMSQGSQFLGQVSDSLQLGGSVLFMWAPKTPADGVIEEIRTADGTIHWTTPPEDLRERFSAALQNEQVNDAAGDSLDLVRPTAGAVVATGPALALVIKKVVFDLDSPSRGHIASTQEVEFDQPVLQYEVSLRGYNINLKQEAATSTGYGVNLAVVPVADDDRKIKVQAIVDAPGPFHAIVQGVVIAQVAPS